MQLSEDEIAERFERWPVVRLASPGSGEDSSIEASLSYRIGFYVWRGLAGACGGSLPGLAAPYIELDELSRLASGIVLGDSMGFGGRHVGGKR